MNIQHRCNLYAWLLWHNAPVGQLRHDCAFGRDLDDALALALTLEVENLCEQYWWALQLGEPHILTEAEMREVFQQFKGYGK
jgi:hypothetical protein